VPVTPRRKERVGESKMSYRRLDFGFDRVYRNHTALFLFHTRPTYLFRMHPIPVGKDPHRKDRGKVGDQGRRDRENGSVNGEGRRGQTRKTWRLGSLDRWRKRS